MEFPWYELADGLPLRQGDIFRDYPLVKADLVPEDLAILANGRSLEKRADVFATDVIVLSQSCDLSNAKIDTVILCPLWTLDSLSQGWQLTSNKEVKKRQEQIRQGREAAWHLINRDSRFDFALSVVEFKRIYTTPKSVLEAFAQSMASRVRLLPPYREHLSQAFARYFMRVGLPLDIPPFK